MLDKKEIETAYEKIKGYIIKTPLEHSQKLSTLSGANVYLKMEQKQLTDSFKIRGVLTKINSLDEKDFNKTFIAASTGNHAAAFGYASEKFGFKGKLFMPKNTSEAKRLGIAKYSIEKEYIGSSSMEAELEATLYSKEIDGVLIHPYNDIEIIKGQGTIAIEIQEQFSEVDTIIVPIGGGGLASGISSYYSKDKNVTIIGCQPENAPEMYESIKKNEIVAPSTLKTIADASAGGIEDNSLTFKICKENLSEIELVNEEDIKKAVAFLYKYHQIIVEPTSALPVATLLKGNKYINKNVVLVLTGKKIDKQLLTEININYGDYY